MPCSSQHQSKRLAAAEETSSCFAIRLSHGRAKERLDCAWGAGERSWFSVDVYQPDVSVTDGISVVLEEDFAGRVGFLFACASLVFDFVIIVNRHAVVDDGDAS